MSLLFPSGGQSTGSLASVTVLPMNIQDLFPFSSQSKGLSRVFSNTTVQEHQFFGAQFSLLGAQSSFFFLCDFMLFYFLYSLASSFSASICRLSQFFL